jgi:hypothetical protein
LKTGTPRQCRKIAGLLLFSPGPIRFQAEELCRTSRMARHFVWLSGFTIRLRPMRDRATFSHGIAREQKTWLTLRGVFVEGTLRLWLLRLPNRPFPRPAPGRLPARRAIHSQATSSCLITANGHQSLLTAKRHEWTLTGSHLFVFISVHSWLGFPLFLRLPSDREQTPMDANQTLLFVFTSVHSWLGFSFVLGVAF